MIIVNQTLHGYANGHQMIASSFEWGLDDRKKMDVLSDLNGRCNKEDLSYYTGYSLSDGKKYVIAKTWYAYEMSRPGCVWTHSIIFDIEDIIKINNFNDVINSFKRPAENNYEDYTKCIAFTDSEQEAIEDNRYITRYMIYTMYGTAIPRIVYFHDYNNEVIKELLFCIQGMPAKLLKDFSFCTMTYEARVYNGKMFSYQITTKSMAETLKIQNPQLSICIPIEKIEKMPYWVNCFYEYLINKRIEEVYNFIANYGENFLKWESFNEFVRIFFLLQNRKNLTINEYFNILLKVMKNDCCELIQRTVDLLLSENFWFYSFENVEYQIVENLDMGVFKLTKIQNNDLYNKIMAGKLEDLFPLLCKYKEGKLKRNSQEFLEKIISNLKPKDLKRVSQMNEDLCVILVRLNPNLLLSEDIWKEKREFQITLLYSSGRWNDLLRVKKLLKLLIKKYKADVANEMYNIYGEEIIPILLEIAKDEIDNDENYWSHWYQIIEKKPTVMLKMLKEFQCKELCRELFCRINFHDKSMIKSIDLQTWNDLFDKIVLNEEDKVWFMKLCLKYAVIIFSTGHHFENQLVRETLKPIYNKMLNDSLSMKEWNYFQYLLPEVEPCHAWDKCLRMREALNIRGYKIKDINC